MQGLKWMIAEQEAILFHHILRLGENIRLAQAPLHGLSVSFHRTMTARVLEVP
ncbi:MAG: hypothetical protein ACKVHE_28860 [Planctomycetales bacterium]|jgi:hypothetical protein